MRISQIIAESERRRRLLETPYNAFTGEGSYIDRIPIEYEKGYIIHVPAEMAETEGVRACLDGGLTVQQYFEGNGFTWNADEGMLKWAKARMLYDYEYWCSVCFNIETKEGGLDTLVLNRPQRLSIPQREEQRLAGRPIRQIELKHRQYGSTTEKNAYVCWFQNVRKRRWNGYIISLQADQAKKIVARYKKAADNYPVDFGSITMAPYFGLTNTKAIKERDCWLAIGTARNPNAPSGDTIQLALISEAGKMASNVVQNAEALVTNIISMVPLAPDTMILVESTAEKTGKWFKNEVARARNGESGFEFLFTSWVSDETRVLPVENPREFAESFSEYERETLWENGATLEQINWYRETAKFHPEPWRMKQENPTTPEEAFAAAERRVFGPDDVQRLRQGCRAPIVRGTLRGAAIEGPGCTDGLELEKDDRGRLRIWRYPFDNYGGYFDLESFYYPNRFCVAADVGGKWEGSDLSNCAVLDRLPTLEREPPEIVADWVGRGDADLFAWICIQICTWYDQARLFIEANFYEKNPSRDEVDPSQGITVLDIVNAHYDNIYLREVYDDVRKQTDYKVGFHTNKKSKPLILNLLNASIRRQPAGYVERNYDACDQLDTYIVHPNGYMGADEGKFDDLAITRALLHFGNDEMDPVKAVPIKKKRPQRVTGAASFT